MGRRARAMVATLAVLAVPALTIRLLHGLAGQPWFRIDYRDPVGWMARTPLADALAAVARVTALWLAYYLLASSLAHLFAVASGSPRLATITRPLALPVVRHLADRVVAGSIAIGALATPLVASTPAPEPTHVIESPADIETAYVPQSRIVDGATGAPDTGSGVVVVFDERPTTPIASDDRVAREKVQVGAPGDVPGPTEVVVGAGDHLWGLAEERMSQALGRVPLDHEVAPYWRHVVDENRNRIRSGNPDVIIAGEIVLLGDPAPFIRSES